MLNIYQVKANLYKVPEIDNRRRNGYTMYQVVCDKLGTPSYAKLHKLDGNTVDVRFTVTGWGEPGKIRV